MQFDKFHNQLQIKSFVMLLSRITKYYPLTTNSSLKIKSCEKLYNAHNTLLCLKNINSCTLTNIQNYQFSSDNKNNNRPNFENIKRYFTKKNYPNIALSLLFVSSLFLYWKYMTTEQITMYPNNLFEQQFVLNCPKETQFQIQINVKQNQKNYKIIFSQKDSNGENKKYYVDYDNNIDYFKYLLTQRHQKIPIIKYVYIEDFKIQTTPLLIVSGLISSLIISYYFLRTRNMGGVQKKSKNSLLNLASQKKFELVQKMDVRFKDVAGLKQTKLEVQQFVDFLKNPAKYKKLGARIPKGILLTGPPGTGKTLLAKACAGQAGVPFIATSGSDFVQIFVGVGASRVRELFALAKQNSPSIIFIDQIDAVGRKRSGSHSSHDERDNTLNQILVEMDGFQTDSNVIIMAATNRQNLLDSALVRPGRFDRTVEVTLPDLDGRRQIFNVHLSRIKMNLAKSKDQYSQRLAALTPGFSGAQIANLCNEAAILAARHEKKRVDAHDLEMAVQRIIGGVQRESLVSVQQKKVVSVHQSGHAVVSWFLQGADPLLKLTIIPRSKGSLGFAQYFVDQTKLSTKTQLIDKICFILGGRCAEQHFFGRVTTGASDDLEKAFNIAHSLVVKLGMNDQIGYVGFKDPEYFRSYSQEMAAKIDDQIKKILRDCTERTRNLVKKHAHQIQQLSNELFQKQTLTIKQIRKVLGDRQYQSGQTYAKYLELQRIDQEDQKRKNVENKVNEPQLQKAT